MNDNFDSKLLTEDHIYNLVKRVKGVVTESDVKTAKRAYLLAGQRYTDISGISFETFAARFICRSLIQLNPKSAQRALDCDELTEEYELSMKSHGLDTDTMYKYEPSIFEERLTCAKLAMFIYRDELLMEKFTKTARMPIDIAAYELSVNVAPLRKYKKYIKALLLALKSDLGSVKSFITKAVSDDSNSLTAVVLKVSDSRAIIFTSDLRFAEIASDRFIFAGERITLKESEILEPIKKKIFDDRSLGAVVAALLIAVASLAAVFEKMN